MSKRELFEAMRDGKRVWHYRNFDVVDNYVTSIASDGSVCLDSFSGLDIWVKSSFYKTKAEVVAVIDSLPRMIPAFKYLTGL